MISYRSEITGSLVSTLSDIATDNDYLTDIGNEILVGGEQKPNDAELPCIILVPGSEAPAENSDPMGSVLVDYQISGFVNRRDIGAESNLFEWEAVDAVIADIREAVESSQCQSSMPIRSMTYEGADPIYSGGETEVCGAVVRYVIQTRQD